MKDVVVIGAGHIGSTIARLLSDCGDYRVIIADRSADQLTETGLLRRVEHQVIDVGDAAALTDLLRGKFAVLSPLPIT